MIKNKTTIAIGIIFFLATLNLFGGGFGVDKALAVDCSALTGDEQTSCEEEKDDIKDDINDLQKKLDKKNAEKALLEQNLGKVQGAVYVTQKVINDTQAQIDAVEKSIKDKESNLVSLEESKERKKEALKKMIQENYLDSDQPFIFIFLNKDNFLEAVTSVDNLLRVKEEVLALMGDIKNDKESIKTEAQQLDVSRKEKESLLVTKEKQKLALENQADGIQEDVDQAMESIASLQEKLSELKSDLNKLLGKSYNTNDVKEAIKFAAKQTGVRKGFLFGMLSIESRLGASVGGCDYKQSRMSATRLAIFKDICDKLDYNYKKQKVSCPPSSYKGTGGAMGAAQFMSDTWRGYQSKIASATGHNPADPWNLVDGVTAMALKLANDGATKSGKTTITSPCTGKKISIKWEEYASLKYLGWSCYGLTNYAKRVQALSGNYDQL
ncbi:MAG: hypothetical protein WC682_01345 [Parcubacteria group bacterium]|jgi:peptidoglycan hydrolase CwlO-like protein